MRTSRSGADSTRARGGRAASHDSAPEAELREAFVALRNADLRAAPSFTSVLGARRQVRGLTWRPALVVAAAAAAVLMLCDARFHPAPDVAAWTAPTDALLPVELPPIMGEPAPLGSSVLDVYLPWTISPSAIP